MFERTAQIRLFLEMLQPINDTTDPSLVLHPATFSLAGYGPKFYTSSCSWTMTEATIHGYSVLQNRIYSGAAQLDAKTSFLELDLSRLDCDIPTASGETTTGGKRKIAVRHGQIASELTVTSHHGCCIPPQLIPSG